MIDKPGLPTASMFHISRENKEQSLQAFDSPDRVSERRSEMPATFSWDNRARPHHALLHPLSVCFDKKISSRNVSPMDTGFKHFR